LSRKKAFEFKANICKAIVQSEFHCKKEEHLALRAKLSADKSQLNTSRISAGNVQK